MPKHSQLPAIPESRKFRLDAKVICIAAIVAFLLVFNVWPMCYLVFRSFFNESGFTLETFKRIYTYPLNWSALRNTLVTAGFTVKLGRDEDEKEKNSKSFGRYSKQPLTSVTQLRKENDMLHAQIDALERENAAAQARLETLERRLSGTRQ